MKKISLKKSFNRIFNNNYKKILFFSFCFIILNISISFITGVNLIETGLKKFLNLFSNDIPNNEVRFNSENWHWDNASSNMGEWGVIKSAEWTSKETARITFEVQTGVKTSSNKKDIILVLDTSNSMTDKQFEKLKDASNKMIEQVLVDETSGNNVALISYNKSASILSYLSNDKEALVSKINGLRTTIIGRNYAAAFRSVRKILEGYVDEEARDLIVLFIANGMASEESPTQNAEFSIIKTKHPKIKIKGIQYAQNNFRLNDLISVSNGGFIEASENNISSKLLSASLMSEEVYSFNKFKINDYINDDFELINKEVINESIKADIGNINYNNSDSSIEWNLSNENFAGKILDNSVKLTIDLKLKNDIEDKNYLTNVKETFEVDYSGNNNLKEYNDSPVLQAKYNVRYESNAPGTCNIIEKNSETYYVFDEVNIIDALNPCSGYRFKGWEILEEDVKKLNDNKFLMPSHDVTIRGVWSKIDILKTMEGTLFQASNLYDKVKEDATVSNKAYTYVENGKTYYYYKGKNPSNNVVYAGHCWEIIKTTDTNGVKLLYNGLYKDNVCTNTGTDKGIEVDGENSFKFSDDSTNISSVGYMYTDDTFKKNLTGTLDTSLFDWLWPDYSNSTKDIYYADKMEVVNGKHVLSGNLRLINWANISDTEKSQLKGAYYCARGEIEADKTTATSVTCARFAIYIAGVDTSSSSKYKDENNVELIANGNIFTISINYGKTIEEVDPLGDNGNLLFGQGYVENPDGTYTLTNTRRISRREFVENSSDFNDKTWFACMTFDSSSRWEDTCTDIQKVVIAQGYIITYLTSERKYTYGNDIKWDGTKYNLIGTEEYPIEKDVWDYTNLDIKYSIDGKHYMCQNNQDSCEEVYYVKTIFGGNSTYNLQSYKLTNGDKLSDVIDALLGNDEKNVSPNNRDSYIKEKVDLWYENNILNQDYAYNRMLENTTFCNDRTVESFGFLDKNSYMGGGSGDITEGHSIVFSSVNKTFNNDYFSCPNKNDQFTLIESGVGNEKLKYPIGLLSYGEIKLVMSEYLYDNAVLFWLNTPSYISTVNANTRMYSLGYYWLSPSIFTYMTTEFEGKSKMIIRPSVSLKKEINYISGDGTKEHPYIMENYSNNN